MSPFSPRPLATLCVAGLWALVAGLTTAAAASDDTWAPLGSLPARLDAPVFALAVDPADGRHLLAATSDGILLRSLDAGASWKEGRVGGRGIAAIAFDPTRPGLALAGTRGAGVWLSADGGLTWQEQPGGEGRTVRAFAFVKGVALAGTDQGVLMSRSGGPWTPAGLTQVRISALAAAGDAVVAGGDATQGSDPVPLYVSGDAGQSWELAAGLAGVGGASNVGGSSMVTALAAPSGGRPLLMGTNAGLFASSDQGATWQQLTGSGVLPAADFTALARAPRHPERLYVASDGGASDQGGLWVSTDAGAHFTTLAPPQPEVTALAVSADDVPQVLVATLRPTDHAVALWAYHDAGGPAGGVVAGPAPSPTPPSAVARERSPSRPLWRVLLAQPETPYLALGAAALLAVVAAIAAYARRGSVH